MHLGQFPFRLERKLSDRKIYEWVWREGGTWPSYRRHCGIPAVRARHSAETELINLVIRPVGAADLATRRAIIGMIADASAGTTLFGMSVHGRRSAAGVAGNTLAGRGGAGRIDREVIYVRTDCGRCASAHGPSCGARRSGTCRVAVVATGVFGCGCGARGRRARHARFSADRSVTYARERRSHGPSDPRLRASPRYITVVRTGAGQRRGGRRPGGPGKFVGEVFPWAKRPQRR